MSAQSETPSSWDEVAGGWERRRAFVWEVTRPVSDRMLALFDPRPGETVLELAAGPGDTGFLAADLIGPAGRLISTDVAPEMVAAARRRAAELGLGNVEFRHEDAQKLDLPDESIDGVLCRWGYMLPEEPARAFAETRRVLRPGGRVAFAVWATPDENPWASAMGRVLLERGLVERPQPDAPGPFRLADPDALRALVTDAGLEVVTVEDVGVLWRHDDFDGYWATSRDLSRTLAVALEGLDPEGVADVRDAIRSALTDYADDEGLAVPGRSRVVLARRI